MLTAIRNLVQVKEAVDEDGSRFAVKIIAKAALVGRSNKEVENLQKEVAPHLWSMRRAQWSDCLMSQVTFMRTLNGHKNVVRQHHLVPLF